MRPGGRFVFTRTGSPTLRPSRPTRLLLATPHRSGRPGPSVPAHKPTRKPPAAPRKPRAAPATIEAQLGPLARNCSPNPQPGGIKRKPLASQTLSDRAETTNATSFATPRDAAQFRGARAVGSGGGETISTLRASQWARCSNGALEMGLAQTPSPSLGLPRLRAV